MLSRNSSTNPLTTLDNETLIKAAHEGDEAAKEAFVEKNQGLVYSCIQRFVSKKISREDLFQIGCVGLMKALNNFDLSMNVQFSTYAVPIIFGEVKRFFRDDGSMRISRSLKEGFLVMVKVKDELFQKLNREPTYSEIAQASGYDVSDVLLAFDANQFIYSLDEPIYEKDGNSLYLEDKISDKDSHDITLRCAMQKEIKALDARDQLLIHYRYECGLKQDEIARKLNISQVQVSRLEKKILKQLKERFVSD